MRPESRNGIPPVERRDGAAHHAPLPDDVTSDFSLPAVPDVSLSNPWRRGEAIFVLFFALFALAKVVEWLLRLLGLL